jgi:radical SAM protein with 4Fe4S-binding SPASM domain
VIPYTKLHETGRQVLKDVLPLGKPFTVLVEPSSRCNFRCLQCFQSLKDDSYFTRSRTNMPLSRFSRIIEQLRAWPGPRLKVLKLSLYGEPLVNPDFGEMLRLARQAGMAERIETTTNASLLTRDLAQTLVDLQLDYLRVSIYATTQERHKEVTGSRTPLRTIHENLRVLQRVKQVSGSERPFVICKMIDAYGEENERFPEVFGDVSDELFIDKPHGWIKVGGTDFIETYYRAKADQVREDLRAGSAQRVACPMAFTTMAVRSNGDVSPCCVDFIGGTNLGNVDADGLQAIWESDGWYEFEKMQLEDRNEENPSCAKCDFYRSSHYAKDDVDGFDVRKLR